MLNPLRLVRMFTYEPLSEYPGSTSGQGVTFVRKHFIFNGKNFSVNLNLVKLQREIEYRVEN